MRRFNLIAGTLIAAFSVAVGLGIGLAALSSDGGQRQASAQQQRTNASPQATAQIDGKNGAVPKDPPADQSPSNGPAVVTAWFTAAIAFLTLVGVITYVESNSHTVVVERAYLKIDSDDQGLRLDDAGRPSMFLKVHNVGKTPAQMMRLSAHLWPHPTSAPLPDLPPYGGSESWDFYLPPGESVEMKDARAQNFIVGDDVRRHRTTTLYVIGYVDYRDAFRNERRVGFARRFNPTPNVAPNLVLVKQSGYSYYRPKEEC